MTYLTLGFEDEADGVTMGEEAIDDGEAEEGDRAGDAHHSPVSLSLFTVRPPPDGARSSLPRPKLQASATPRQHLPECLHLRLQTLRAPQHTHPHSLPPPSSLPPWIDYITSEE